MFYTRVQQQGENVSNFGADLRKNIGPCEFGDISYETMENQALRDQFVIDLVSSEIRKCLLVEKKLTLQKAVAIAETFETTTEEVHQMA